MSDDLKARIDKALRSKYTPYLNDLLEEALDRIEELERELRMADDEFGCGDPDCWCA